VAGFGRLYIFDQRVVPSRFLVLVAGDDAGMLRTS
jgi:hypothetical protein